MEESFNVPSEEFRKYLIEVIYEEHRYFTVWGTDLTDNALDKWLVDETGHILLFSELSSLLNSLRNNSSFFDHENVMKWIKHCDWSPEPYNLSNFDLLIRDDFNYSHASLIDLYDLIGNLEDFAIQTVDEDMKSLFRSDLFMQFKDEAADTFLWEGRDEFDRTFDFKTLSKHCIKLHGDLRGKISGID